MVSVDAQTEQGEKVDLAALLRKASWRRALGSMDTGESGRVRGHWPAPRTCIFLSVVWK